MQLQDFEPFSVGWCTAKAAAAIKQSTISEHEAAVEAA